MGFFSKLFKKADPSDASNAPQLPEKLSATVRLNSPVLLAFDLPSEGVRYEIPDFSPGLYEIPMEAIKEHKAASNTPDSPGIEVDTATIFFIDAEFEQAFRNFEETHFEEHGDPYDIMDAPEQFAEQVGIRFDCLMSPGIGTGYDFIGDGVYVLDVTLIRRLQA